MKLTLIGADYEENLGVGMIAAAALQAGHTVSVVPFNSVMDLESIARRVIAEAPAVVGLSIQFQHRASEFLGLSARLKGLGYAGHITCGGQFPTMAFREVLRGPYGVDSVVLHEGERTIVELLGALTADQPLDAVSGIAYRAQGGGAERTAPRPLVDDLDSLPLPFRYRAHTTHLGLPFVPLMGSRGCWGKCSFCSISSFYRDARATCGGKLMRTRSAESVAEEIALYWHAAGGRGVFCFHDDSFLLPKPEASLARVQAIRAALDRFGVRQALLIGKCRPDSLTVELAQALAQLGVVRLYVGVENVAEGGAAHLARGMHRNQVEQALSACEAAKIFCCYNLLIFEPHATLADVAENIDFIRGHAAHPVNFCRAEAYHGTPLYHQLKSEGRLQGSILGYDYRIADDRTELMFRMAAAAFRQRNFDESGVHNRYMGLGYNARLLERAFGDDRMAEREPLCERADHLTRSIALETADFLTQALDFASSVKLAQRDRIERTTALLGMSISAADRRWHAQIDALYRDMRAFVGAAGQPPKRTKRELPQELLRVAQRLAQSVAVGSMLAAWSVGLAGCERAHVVDPAPKDGGRDFIIADPLPRDAGSDAMLVDPPPRDGGRDSFIADPPPRDMGRDHLLVDPAVKDRGIHHDANISDPLPPDGWVGDAVPSPDAGVQPVPDGLIVDPAPHPGPQSRREDLIDQFRDTAPRHTLRTADLPLFDPPVVRIIAKREGSAIRATLSCNTLQGAAEIVSTRWESDGPVEVSADGHCVLWSPESDADQLRLGVRSKGGVAVVALRARDVA